jgi:hypothetical protein
MKAIGHVIKRGTKGGSAAHWLAECTYNRRLPEGA